MITWEQLGQIIEKMSDEERKSVVYMYHRGHSCGFEELEFRGEDRGFGRPLLHESGEAAKYDEDSASLGTYFSGEEEDGTES